MTSTMTTPPTQTLTPFWRFVELRPSRAAVMTDWRSVAGDELSTVAPLLVPAGRMATAYPNPRGGLMLRVVHHHNGDIVAVDNADWEHRIKLTSRDIVIHQFDLRTARVAFCDLLTGVNIVRSPIEQTAACTQIGNWEPKKGASFPVYLLLCPMRTVLRQQVLELQLQHRNRRPGAILLTPTRASWDDELVALARDENMLLVPLCEVLHPHNGTISTTPAWEEYLQAFCQMVKLSLPGNFQNKRPVPMRGTRTADIEKIEKFLEEHIIRARDHAYTLESYGREPKLLPRPRQKYIAKHTGLSESDVSRCLKDPRATVLKILWETAGSLDGVMSFKRHS